MIELVGQETLKRIASGPHRRVGRKEQINTGKINKQIFTPKTSLCECQVGVTEFVNNNAGFTGVIKARFSDFHVNEIDLKGKVLVLDDLRIPHESKDNLTTAELNEVRSKLNELLTSEQRERIHKLAEKNAGDTSDEIEIDINELDKEKRTELHQALKKLYAGKLVSTTVNIETNQAAVSAKQITEKKRLLRIIRSNGGRKHIRSSWSFSGQYVHFLVHKENTDTSEVACAMADRMKLRPSQVNYCGTKDKRAKTTQKFCIKKRSPSQIVGSVKALKNVHVGNFEFSDEVLKLGDLRGNRFRIALRHIRGDQQEIEVALQKVRDNGFINYFGLQRFGNSASVPTYEVGMALLKADYKLACELILKPRDNDVPFMRSIRETWWRDRDSVVAAKIFSSDKFIEKKLLDGLVQYGENDYASALRKIPRNMLMLYTHAFQSLIFNRIASRRIKEFGLHLIQGDLVYRNKNELDDNTEELLVENVDESMLLVDEKQNSQNMNNPAKSIDSIFKRKVKPLTIDEIDSGNYTLFDVVLPLPGYDITYPANIVGEWYEKLLEESGLSSEKLWNNVKTYALTGSYRKLVCQPSQMSWEFRSYNKAECTLISSDWELLKSTELTPVLDSSGGNFKALILDFCLPPATYATMLLRELLKADTAPATQAQLQQKELQNDVCTDIEKDVNSLRKKRLSTNEEFEGVDVKLIKLQ